jgi:hypothetical protein
MKLLKFIINLFKRKVEKDPHEEHWGIGAS